MRASASHITLAAMELPRVSTEPEKSGKANPSTVLTFNNAKVVVKATRKKEAKVLLDGVTGFVKSGTVLAIMGPSGAGKSTLLDFISQKRAFMNSKKLEISGESFINGHLLSPDLVKTQCSYVPQTDALHPSLSVRENLVFSGRFNLPPSQHDQIPRMVDQILQDLGLVSCQNTKIGNVFIKGVSGGQKKRTSVGVELMNPAKNVLFLDEPTTGLDAASALHIMNDLMKLAREKQKAIVAVVHQPSTQIFHNLDQLLLLAQGKTVFFGDSKQAMGYFSSLGREPESLMNPADFLLDEVNADFTSQDSVAKITAAWGDSSEAEETREEVEKYTSTTPLVPTPLSFSHILSQNKTMAHRIFLSYVRDPAVYLARIINYLVLGLMSSSLFFDGISDDRSSALFRVNFFVLTIAFASYQSSNSLPSFYLERTAVTKEVANGHYGVGVYVAQQAMLQLPAIFIVTLFAAVPGYWIVGLREEFDRFLVYIIILFSELYTNEALASLMGGMISNFMIAIIMFNSIVSVNFLFSGLFIPLGTVPSFLRWMPYLSMHKYTQEAMTWSQFEGADFVEEDGTQVAGEIVIRDVFPDTNNQFYKGSDIAETEVGLWILYIWLFALAYRVMYYFALKRFV